MRFCKTVAFVLPLALAATLAWPLATAQDHGDPKRKEGAGPHGGVHPTSPQTVSVVFLAGQAAPEIRRENVTGFGVEEMGGAKFLVLTVQGGERVYFAYDKVLVISAKPSAPVAPK